MVRHMTPRSPSLAILLLIAIAIAACAEPRKRWTSKNIYEAVASAEAERETWK